MRTYAVLGATGSTGSSILRYLHERPDKVKINVYARSASKIESLHPYIKNVENIELFCGDLSDINLLKHCLRGADAIFSAVAQNSNEPGCSIAQRTAHTIVSALESSRKEEGANFHCPILVFLSSASLNTRFREASPRLLIWVIERGNCYIYADLAKAVMYLKEQAWIPLITADPGALVHDVSRGFELSLEKIGPLLSYEDLARGMVQMVEEDNGRKWVGQGVGIKATGIVRPYVWPLVKYQVTGLLACYFPSLWRAGTGVLW